MNCSTQTLSLPRPPLVCSGRTPLPPNYEGLRGPDRRRPAPVVVEVPKADKHHLETGLATAHPTRRLDLEVVVVSCSPVSDVLRVAVQILETLGPVVVTRLRVIVELAIPFFHPAWYKVMQ